MSNIINQIMNDQKEKRGSTQVVNFQPTNELENIHNTLKSINPYIASTINNTIPQTETNDNTNKAQEFTPKENTYENILNEIQEHEAGMEKAIQEADELGKTVKDSVMYYLDIRKPNRNGILFHGVPDVLNASARLLDLSINGRYKLASMKRLRASIIKDSTSSDNKGEVNLAVLLAGDSD